MVHKAIIPVAGWGTRMLPITKSIEKCMLPIGNRPLIDYVVQDCLAAGIDEFIFIVSEHSGQLESYYRSNIHLNDYLRRKGKDAMLSMVAPLKAKMHFVVQPRPESRRSDSMGFLSGRFSVSRESWESARTGQSSSRATPLSIREISATSCCRLSVERPPKLMS